VPRPEGFAWLAQEIFADDYRGAAVTFGSQLRTPDATGRAGLFLRVMKPRDLHGPFTALAYREHDPLRCRLWPGQLS
jgi:hypothetical protein